MLFFKSSDLQLLEEKSSTVLMCIVVKNVTAESQWLSLLFLVTVYVHLRCHFPLYIYYSGQVFKFLLNDYFNDDYYEYVC